MPSPFPGMNPYLEQDDAWHDSHETFCTAAKHALVAQVQPNYIVKIDEHVYIHAVDEEDGRLAGRGDVSVAALRPVESDGLAATLAAPAYARLLPDVDFDRQSFLEIRDRRTRRLVTVIELLSPSDKRPGPDRDQYQSKRKLYLYSAVNFVEIDLLRGGPKHWPVEWQQELPACDYHVLVYRPEEWPRVGVWPFGLRDPLPRIPVPLLAPDPHAWLELQALLDQVYDASGYDRYIYESAPDPPLSAADGEWARQFTPKPRA